jgi:hypothetical protein
MEILQLSFKEKEDLSLSYAQLFEEVIEKLSVTN